MFNKRGIEDAFGATVAITPLMQAKQEEWRNLVSGAAP